MLYINSKQQWCLAIASASSSNLGVFYLRASRSAARRCRAKSWWLPAWSTARPTKEKQIMLSVICSSYLEMLIVSLFVCFFCRSEDGSPHSLHNKVVCAVYRKLDVWHVETYQQYSPGSDLECPPVDA